MCQGMDIKTRHGKMGGSGRVWIAGQTGHELSQVASWVELTRIFQTIFFFFFLK